MADFPGGADEVIRVRWISEFRQEGKNITGSFARASQEYQKAAREQVRSNQVMIKSAKEAAKASKEQQDAERDRLKELRSFALQEHNIVRSRDSRLSAMAKARQKEDLLLAKGKDRLRAAQVALNDEIKQITIAAASKKKIREIELRDSGAAIREETRTLNNAVRERRKILDTDVRQTVAASKAETQGLLLSLRDQRAALNREARRRVTTPERQDLIKGEREQLNAQIREIQKGGRGRLSEIQKAAIAERSVLQKEIDKNNKIARERVRKERSLSSEDITQIRKDSARIVRETKIAGSQKRAALQKDLEDTIVVQRQKIAAVKAEADNFETQLKRLEKLRGEFGPQIEKMLRRGGLNPSGQDIDRIVRQASNRVHMPDIVASKALRDFESSAQRISHEMRTAGRVSSTAFNDLKSAADRASISTHDFTELTHRAGISIKNFASEKNREIKLLRTNTSELGKHNSRMGKANGLWQQLRGGLRLSTNEMILFGRTMSLLAIPTMAAAVSVLAQALTTAAGGATALVSSLAPLVGQLGAIPGLLMAGAQAMTVWKIGMTNLGKSSMTVGKIISTALGGSQDQFVTSLKDLPKTAQMFAVNVRAKFFPVYDKLRTDIQKRLFPAFFDAAKFASPGLRGFGGVLRGTADQIANVFRQVGGRIGNPLFNKDLVTQGQRTNQWIKSLVPSILNLVDAFRNLVIASAPLTGHLFKMVESFTRWLAVQSGVARATGQMNRFFRQANSTLDTTLSLFGHFAKALINIGHIANQTLGGQMLKDLRDQAVLFERWTKGGVGAAKIAGYFHGLKTPLYEAGRLLRDLVKAMFEVTDNQGFFNVLNKLRTEVLPALVEMLQQVNKTFTPALLDLFVSFAKTIATLAEAGSLTGLVNALKLLSDVVRTIAQSPFSGVIFKLLAGIAIFRTLRFASAISGVTLLTRNFISLKNAMGLSVFQASRLNEALARRGLVGYRPPGVIGSERIGGVTASPVALSSSPSTFGFRRPFAPRSPGSTILLPTAVAQQDMHSRASGGFLRRNADIAGGAAGLGLATAGSFIPGKAGTILQLAGTGAAIGAAFGGLGAVVGGVAGGLAGFAISVANTQSSIEKLGDAAEKTAEKTGTARDRLRSAREDIRGALLGRAEAGRNLGVQQTQLARLRRTPGAQGQVEQQVFAVQQAREVFRETRHRVSEDLRVILSSVPTLKGGRQDFTKQVLDAFALSNKAITVPAAVKGQSNRLVALTKIREERIKKWIEFLDGLQRTRDPVIQKIGADLEKITRKDGKLRLPSKQQVVIEFKAFGPDPLLQFIFGNAKALRGGKLSISDYRPVKKAYGGRIPGVRAAVDNVPALLSPGEFVVTGHGERILEQMTGVPGVLDYVGAVQRPHFNVGGRVQKYAYGGRVTPFSSTAFDDSLQSAFGGSTYQSVVSGAIDASTSAMAGLDTKQATSGGDYSKGTPVAFRGKIQRMLAEARQWVRLGVRSAPGIGLGAPGRLLNPHDDYRQSKVNGISGLDPGAVISDILRSGAGMKFPSLSPNGLLQYLEPGKSKYLTVWLRPGASDEYSSGVKIGNKGFAFSGGRFTTHDAPAGGGVTWLQYHVPGWPMRRGGRIPGYGRGGRLKNWLFGPNGLGGAAHDLVAGFDPRGKGGLLNLASILAPGGKLGFSSKSLGEMGLTREVTASMEGKNVGRLSYVKKGDGWEVLNAVVHPLHKRQGIGRAMFREAERQVHPSSLRHSDLLTEEGSLFARGVQPLRKRVGGWIKRASGAVFHGAASGVGTVANFFGGLSHKDNMNWQAEFLAKDLRARGFSDKDAWGFAHQFVKTYDINSVAKEGKYLPVAANQLRSELFHHRRAGGRIARFKTGGPAGAAPSGVGLLFGEALRSLIVRLSKKYGVDPMAALAVVASEGGLKGAIGDKGTSFGPFQLHAGGALPVPVSQGYQFAQSAAGVEYAIRKIAAVSGGLHGVSAVRAIVSGFEKPANVGAEIARATSIPSSALISAKTFPSGGGGGGAGGGPYGLISQAKERGALTGFANGLLGKSAQYLGTLRSSLEGQLSGLQDQLLKAQLAGKVKIADKISVKITQLESRLEILGGAVGSVIFKLSEQITKSTSKVSGIQDVITNRLARLGVDPAGATALKLTLASQVKVQKQQALQLRLSVKQLKDLRAAGAPQDLIDSQVQAVQASRQGLRGAATNTILTRRAIVARRFERGETRTGVAEQLAEMKLSNLETQQRIAGTFDQGGGARAGFIRSEIIPALQKQIAAAQATLDHASKLKLTEDQKNEKLIQLQQLNNQLAEAQLSAQEAANSLLAKTLGKLTFDFNGQSFSDMIGAGVGL